MRAHHAVKHGVLGATARIAVCASSGGKCGTSGGNGGHCRSSDNRRRGCLRVCSKSAAQHLAPHLHPERRSGDERSGRRARSDCLLGRSTVVSTASIRCSAASIGRPAASIGTAELPETLVGRNKIRGTGNISGRWTVDPRDGYAGTRNIELRLYASRRDAGNRPVGDSTTYIVRWQTSLTKR